MASKKQDTIKRILEAATASFADQGFEGARIDEIAASAQVNKATIYYHIGDKKALYGAVLHDVFSQQVDLMADQLASVDTPRQRLHVFIRCMHRLIDERPHIPAIIMREIASGGKHFPEILIHDFERIIELMGGVLDQGHSQGDFVAANPLVVHLMALAPAAYYKKLDAMLHDQKLCDDSCLLRTDLSYAEFAAAIENLVVNSLLPPDAKPGEPEP